MKPVLEPPPTPSLRKRRFPPWLAYSILTVLLWGAWGIQSKVVVERVSPWVNQVFFPLGLVPAVLPVLFSRNLRSGRHPRRGAAYGFLTGVLGGAGNVAFFLSLDRGGAASIVVPLTCMAPLVTVLLARVVLGERLRRPQMAGIAVSVAAIVLLSV
jgi:transporter family protein